MSEFARYEAYKDSGVEWLGEIPEHWNLIKSKYLWREKEERSINGDETLLSVSQYHGILPNISDSRSESLIDYKNVSTDDLVINIMLAWMGGLGISNYEGIVSPAYCVYKQIKNNSSQYLGYLYRTQIYLSEFAKHSKGVVPSRWRMYTDDFGQILTLLPPILEQNKIVAFLDQKTTEIDEAIAKKQRLIELLKEQKAILINQAVTKGLNPNVPMRNSGVEWIGDIPAHWKIIPNRFVFKEINERSKTGSEMHLSMSQKFGVVPATEVAKSLESESYEGAKLVFKNDLVLNRLKAHLAVFSPSLYDGLVSPDYSVFRLINPEYQVSFFSNLFRTPIYLAELNRRVKGIVVGFLRLYSDDFNAIPSIVPPEQEQQEIVLEINRINDEIKLLTNLTEQEIEKLKEFKQTLIAHAVTGKIKV